MPIQTIINRSDKEIHSQNKVVKNYAQQLKSAVISTERKKAILKEMQSEMIAQTYRKAEKRSAPKTKNTTLKDNDTAESLVSYSVVHTPAIQLELQTATQIQTGKIVTAPVISKSVDRSFIKTQRSTDFIRTARITYSDSVKSVMAQSAHLDEKMKMADKAFRRKAVLRNMQMKQMRLKNKKYTIAKTDSENSLAIESVQTVTAAAGTVSQAGGMLKTAVKGTSKGVGTIHSMVKKGVKIGSAKDVGKIATSVGGSIKILPRIRDISF